MKPVEALKALLTVTLGIAVPCMGATVAQYGGTYGSWPTSWTPLVGVNDGDDGLADDWLDFVGNSASPGGYYAIDTNYVYLRLRVDAGAVTSGTYSDSVIALINRPALNPTYPNHADYGFAWDSKSGDNSNHGLEMQIPSTRGNQWAQNRMGDTDGSSGQKLPSDINGNSRTGDGYLRTVDGQDTAAFGTTSFVDFAVSWSYLSTYTSLNPANFSDWSITFASISDANDHNFLNGDIAGGVNPTSLVSLGWGAIPEPLTLGSLGVMGALAMLRRRR